MKAANRFTSIGGQAVIEGVMMRSPRFIAVAVRKPDQKIKIRHIPYAGIGMRWPMLKRPVLRGVIMLLESMILGIDALSFSANIAASEDDSEGQELSKLAIFSSVGVAFVLGMGLFVALPHALTALATSGSRHIDAQSPLFHLLDGLLKIFILLIYVYSIALIKDVHRVFQYHGAEHKSIYVFESGKELTIENARGFSTLHPRCGTSFLLFLVLISILVFSAVFPFFDLNRFSGRPLLNHGLMVLLKIALMFPVAGLAYEFIKACACRMGHPVFRAMVWPGMILQRLTTREPDDAQLEVALASLRTVLLLEKTRARGGPEASRQTASLSAPKFSREEPGLSREVAALGEIDCVSASVADFPEL
jgi:uncharacterized protein YqhQ